MGIKGPGHQENSDAQDKRGGRVSLVAKRAEHVQGPEINLGKLLPVYFMRPQGLKRLVL